MHARIIMLVLSLLTAVVAHAQTALSFSGSRSSGVSLPTGMTNQPTSFTIEMWVKPTIQNPNYVNQDLIHNHGNGQYMLTITPAYHVVFAVKFSNNEWYNCFSQSAIDGNTYHHIAGQFLNGTFWLFIDGQLNNMVIINQPGLWQPSPPLTAMGRSYIQQNYFEGLIDEVRLSSIARYTENFIPQRLYAVDSSTIALWHCDEGTGSILHDASPNHFDGTISGALWSSDAVVSAPEPQETQLPQSLGLDYFPNPFNATTTIRYTVPAQRKVVLSVFDETAREVATLVNENQNPGEYSVKFDGTTLATGTYFLCLRAGKQTETRKMVLLK